MISNQVNSKFSSHVVLSDTQSIENQGNGLSVVDFEGFLEIKNSFFKFNEANGV